MCDGDRSFVLSRDTRNSFWTKNGRNREISILDEKTKFTILDEIWTKNGQMIGVIVEKKLSNSFTFIGITIMLLQLGRKN